RARHPCLVNSFSLPCSGSCRSGICGTTLQEAGTSLGPWLLLRVGLSKDRRQGRRRIFGLHHCVDRLRDRRNATDVATPRVAVTEAPRPAAGELTEPDIGK